MQVVKKKKLDIQPLSNGQDDNPQDFHFEKIQKL